MSAVLGCTFGEAAGNKESRKLVQALIKECIDVCKAGGISIEPVQGKDIVKLLDYNGPVKKAFSFFIIPIAIRKHALLKASMLQDLEKGKLYIRFEYLQISDKPTKYDQIQITFYLSEKKFMKSESCFDITLSKPMLKPLVKGLRGLYEEKE
jgi:hypothetical protein